MAMDFSSMPCEESVATKSLKTDMIKYCMNTMRKRTIDEQIGDLSAIMNCSLDLKIVYKRTELEVSYSVGSLSASVNGSDESTCVRQCKRDILHKLKVFCNYSNDVARTSSLNWQVRKDKSSESGSETQDVYSEVELLKEQVSGKATSKAFNDNIVLVDPEMDIPNELYDLMNENESPLVLIVSYLPTEWNMTFECGVYSASTNGPIKSTNMQQIKMLLLQELSAFVTDENVVNQEVDDTFRTIISCGDDNFQEDKLRNLSDDEISQRKTSNESLSTHESREASDLSVVSAVESDKTTSNGSNESWNNKIEVYEKFNSDCNRNEEIARNEPKSSENQRCDSPNRNKINQPAVDIVVQSSDNTNHIPASMELPETRSNQQPTIPQQVTSQNEINKPAVDPVSRPSENTITIQVPTEIPENRSNQQPTISSRVTSKNEINKPAVDPVSQPSENTIQVPTELPENRSIQQPTLSQRVTSQNEINKPAVDPVSRHSVNATRIQVSTNLPESRSNQQPSKTCNIPKPHEKYDSRASAVLKNVTWNTFWESAKQFFDILVQTNRGDQLHLKMITDCLVSNAIDKPDDCALYATLCCDVIEKAYVDSRGAVRQGLPRAFKKELIQSCRDVLTESGVLPLVGTAQHPQDSRRSEQRFDVKHRDRTLGTCRLMGELFMRDQMFKTVMNTVDTFMQIHDVQSLECLCVLLIIIGPKLEEIIDAPRLIYEPLERYLIDGYAGNNLLPPRTVHMIDLVLYERVYYANRSNSWSGDFDEEITRKANKCRRREMQSNDRRANCISGEYSRYNRNPPSNSARSSQNQRKRITFNPVTTTHFYRDH